MGIEMFSNMSRRQFLGTMAVAGTAAFMGIRPGIVAAEPPPETTTIRIQGLRSACWVPQVVAEDLLHEEGFSDVQYIKYKNIFEAEKDMSAGKLDLFLDFTGRQIRDIVPGSTMVFISGLHAGCYSLIGSEKVGSIRDLKGKKVWAWTSLEAGPVVFFKALISYVGLDPDKDVEYVLVSRNEALELFKKGEIDAFMSFPPGPQQLKEQGIGKVLVDTNVDRPWSQYFCCIIVGSRDFIGKYPVATKRALRAILKSNDIVAGDPEGAAQLLVDRGLKSASVQKHLAQAFREIPYAKWREYNPEDTIRFYALRLKELGMTKYNPTDIIEQNTEWRFLKQLKDELGMTWV